MRAGSFQCVWFCGGLTRAELEGASASEAGPGPDGEEAGFAVAGTCAELPRLAPASRLKPAERRWRKKQKRMEGGGGPT